DSVLSQLVVAESLQPVAFCERETWARAWMLPKTCSQFTPAPRCFRLSPASVKPAVAEVLSALFCRKITEICPPGAYGQPTPTLRPLTSPGCAPEVFLFLAQSTWTLTTPL